MGRPRAILHTPSLPLGACLMAAIERDTRGCVLGNRERFNFYPATPLPTISWIFEGSLHLAEDRQDILQTDLPLGQALPTMIFSGPQRWPTVSWSPGPVYALTAAIYPEAMGRLLGQSVAPWLNRTVPLAEVAPAALLRVCQGVLASPDSPFARLENELLPLWHSPAQRSTAPYISDWINGLATRALHSAAGKSLRQWQRHIRAWTGQSQRDLQIFVRTEEAFIRRLAADKQPSANLADIAAESGFADQSHMGREIKRITGIPPGRFGERMAQEESFWYYRLIANEIDKPTP